METVTILENLSWINQVAGGVWIFLTGLMLFVISRIYKSRGWKNESMYWMLILLIAVWLYPVYTGFYRYLIIGEIGNVLTLVLTLLTFLQVNKSMKKLSFFLIPQLLWLSIATIYVGIQISEYNM